MEETNLKKLKILFFTQYFWPENFRINELVNFFSSKNNKNLILTSYPSYPNNKLFKNFKISDDKKFTEDEIIRIPVIPRSDGNLALILNYLSFFLNSFFYGLFVFFKKKFKLIFLFSPSPIFSVLPIILINKIFKKKIVIWILDLWPDTIVDLKIVKNKFLIKILKKIILFIYDNCDLILAQSNSIKEEIEKISKTKCIFFPSWPEEGINDDKIEYSPKLNKRQSDITRIMFTGNIGEAQSFETLIKAAKILKNKKKIEWVLIGDGRFKNKLKKLIKQNNLEKEFILLNPVPLKSIKSFFNHADALYLSLKNNSTYEKTIPGKLSTYMSAQKPIIASISGETKNIILNSKSGLVSDAENYRELANNISKFTDYDLQLRNQLGINAKNFCKINYKKNDTLNNLKKNLENLLKTNNDN